MPSQTRIEEGQISKERAVDSDLKKVEILILNWNRKDYTAACLESLKSINYQNFEILLIDNGSTDGSEAFLRKYYPETKFLQTGANLGYSGGNNRGIQEAFRSGSDYVFILNNDTKLDSACLEELIKAAEANPEIGIAGPVACDYENLEKVLHAGHEFDWKRMRVNKLSWEEASRKDRGNYFEADCLQGDALLIKKEVLERIGLFDERFFLYYEDTDFCYRAKAAGYQCAVVKQARYQHMTCGTLQAGNPKLTHYLSRNGLLFVSKHSAKNEKAGNVWRFLKKVAADIGDYNVYRWKKTKDKVYLKDILFALRGVFDFFTGRFGKI